MKRKLYTAFCILIITMFSFPYMSSFSVNAAERLVLSEPFYNEDGVITLNDREWYKVNYFEKDKPYLIAVVNDDGTESLLTNKADDSESCVWNYERRTNTTSTTAPHTALSSNFNYLMCYGNETDMKWSSYISSDSVWSYEDGFLCYYADNEKYYVTLDSESRTGLGCTSDIYLADKVNIYTHGQRLGVCITKQPVSEGYVIADSGYSAPSYSVEVSENVVVDSVSWYVDDEIFRTDSLDFTAYSLENQPVGVHQIKCLVEGHDAENTHYRETSASASFIITNGVMENSFITFSDLHEEFTMIGKAVETVMNENNGCIPSLIICTGDWVNGPSGDYDRVMEWYYPRLVSQFGGIDAVFVAGNHDNSSAAVKMSQNAVLGADKEFDNYNGVIFNGSSDEVFINGKSSKNSSDLIVYGLNFSSADEYTEGNWYYNYDRVISRVKSFLDETAKHYNGELIVFSAHSGLHAVGIQPESINPNSENVTQWGGGSAYNIDNSDKLAEILNSYAENYGMNILYLFGHNHSRKETEMFLTNGDTLVSTHSFDNRATVSDILKFTYAHSGYISNEIGCADGNFSFIKINGSSYSYDLMKAENGIIKHYDVDLKQTESADITVTSTAVSSKYDKVDSPHTADDFSVVLWLGLIVFVGMAWRLRRRNNN
ncbi:MAG: metallophosphoesterase [Ruminococcus sp.]|nr:metallophosphoesterase [Ruminococcus sp.]